VSTLTEDELFAMVNLYPKNTGLLMTVWVGPTDHTHAPRIKVNMAHGDRMNPTDTAVVALLPEPHLIGGDLSGQDFKAVSAWIALNLEAILDHWHGRIDGADMAAAVRRMISAPRDNQSELAEASPESSGRL
jgi:hypothetical protein